MKTIKKNLAILMLALFGLGIIGHNASFGTEVIKEAPPPGGGGSDDCDLCVIEQNGQTLFSCKPHPNKSCSEETTVYDPPFGTQTISVYCAGAEEC